MQPLLNVQEVAKLLGVSKETIWRLVRGHDLPSINISSGGPGNKTGRRMRFHEEDVQAFLKERRQHSSARGV